MVAAHSEDMVTREKLIDDIKAESAMAKEFEGIVSNAFTETAAMNGEASLESVDSEVLKYEAAVSEAKENVVEAEDKIASLKEELSAITMRVPILEDLKKTAASKRDFKAAGKASKEIKDALARKEQCQAELDGEAMERQKFVKDELEKISALLEEKKSIAAEKGKEAGLKQMEMLRGKIDDLKSIMKKYASGATEEAEEDAINVSCVGAFVIESQICVLEAEGKVLGDKYGGWDTSSDVVEDSSVHSAPSFGSENEDIIIDESVLEKYISLRNQMKELDAAIEKAAQDEDYENAAELEEQAQSIREEFDAAGFQSEKFEQAVKDFTNKQDSSAADDSEENDDSTSEKIIDESVLEKYTSLCAIIKEAEADIETAVADEDFDLAAQLEEKVQAAHSDIASLGFTVDELDAAKNNADSTTTVSDADRGNANVEEIDEKKDDDAGDENVNEECTDEAKTEEKEIEEASGRNAEEKCTDEDKAAGGNEKDTTPGDDDVDVDAEEESNS